ncbi:unnamed protein product [Penicillium olsonii]|nr:unnamed protein product [Penicillium olsonii]
MLYGDRTTTKKATDTKEKPFLCQCGSSFSRRDLLTRHRRLTGHEEADPPPDGTTSEAGSAGFSHRHWQQSGARQVDSGAVVSLSGLNGPSPTNQPWAEVPDQTAVAGEEEHDGTTKAQQSDFDLFSPIIYDGIDFDTHFREFTNFLDGVGLPNEWSPVVDESSMDGNPFLFKLGDATENTEAASPGREAQTRAGTPFSSWLPSAPGGTKSSHHVAETDNFLLPSRHALTRYIGSFFGGFHSHMPFIHVPTWQIHEHSPELVLGIAAIGAHYCFERRVSERLFFAGKAILIAGLEIKTEIYGLSKGFGSACPYPTMKSQDSFTGADQSSLIESIRALITLMGFATWEPKASMVQEAFALQEILTFVIREAGLEDADNFTSATSSDEQSDAITARLKWRSWVEQESSRRTRLIAFSFLHTHSIAYNVYPTLRSNEIGLQLPCSTKEWKAPNELLWHAARKEIRKPQLYFKDALSLLLKNRDELTPLDPIPTPLGNYVLLHGLLQRIHIVRDLCLPVVNNTAALPREETEKLGNGLRSWTSCWQQAPESTLDPNNENGPIPFTSSALLALAYTRIYMNLGPYRELETRDPQLIAHAIASSPPIERSDGVIAALLYSVHMMSIPVKLGIDRVAKSQAFFWSVRHSLSSLECGVLLSKWLSRVAETMAVIPLSDSEDRIMYWVRCIIEEAYSVVDFYPTEFIDFRNPLNLSFAVLQLWAHFFKSNTQWPLINILGQSLEKYREILIQNRRTHTAV